MNWLILHRKIIAVYSEKHGINAGFFLNDKGKGRK